MRDELDTGIGAETLRFRHAIDVAEGYQIKRIHVNPGCRLSYQTHEHRSERWVIVFGTATCTIDGQVVTAGPGATVAVPQGGKHRLANDGSGELIMVVVQRGVYRRM